MAHFEQVLEIKKEASSMSFHEQDKVKKWRKKLYSGVDRKPRGPSTKATVGSTGGNHVRSTGRDQVQEIEPQANPEAMFPSMSTTFSNDLPLNIAISMSSVEDNGVDASQVGDG